MIKLIKTLTTFYIGKEKDKSDSIILEKPLEIMIQFPDKMGLRSILFLEGDTLQISNNVIEYILDENQIDKRIVKMYREAISGIIAPNDSDVSKIIKPNFKR